MSGSFLLTYRRAYIIAVHLLLWAAAFFGAFLLRFDFTVPGEYFPELWSWLLVLLGARAVSSFVFGGFHGLWRYTGTRDLVALLKATSVSSVVFVVFIAFAGFRAFPRSIFIIEWLLSIMLVGGLRLGIRKLRELVSEINEKSAEKRRILIVGAGDAGEMLLRELQKNQGSRYAPVGFLDDDARKRGARIHGVPVLGSIEEVPAVAKKHEVEEIIIAIPTATGAQMRRILSLCRPCKLHLRTIPGLNQLIDGKVTVNQLRDVAIDDLLGRKPVQLDEEEISACVTGAVVLVSGAGGSIGSELCRQVARFGPKRLILVERTENNLFQIHRELSSAFPELSLVPFVADVGDESRIRAVFKLEAPQVVFHAAAHKHVPMMEWNPGEAVKNNIRGTRVLADVANAFGAERFVMISTDKAVNPTSVMGVTKRIAEIYIQTLSERSSTRFVTVRFGNVLGSAGSVIPIFKEQIASGGPVTVTHPEMRRYFMTIPEACQLVLQAGSMGEGGEIFVLDMGEPVKIVDLARDLISLSGLTPGEDIEIEFSGVRPGEKLFEELSMDEEKADRTKHPKIFVGRFKRHDWDDVRARVTELEGAADEADAATLKRSFHRVVPEYAGGRGEAPATDEAATEEPAARAAVIPLRR